MVGMNGDKLKVAVLPADTGACGHLRLIWPAEAIHELHPEWDITIYDPRNVKLERGRTLRVHGMDTEGLDLLVTQRVGTATVADLCASIRATGAAVLMDVDDAMWCLDPDNTAYGSWNGLRGGAHWERTDRAASNADLVTVTTSALAARYSTHTPAAVLPNRIPRMALDARRPKQSSTPPVAGWAGLLATHPHDPDVIGDALKIAVSRGLVSAGVIGDGYRTGKVWGVPVRTFQVARLGMEYFRRLAMFDIGLVPLDLEGSSAEFNSAKSSLKALEYAATGSAVIASPSPANIEFAREVPIRLAATPGEWLEHLTELSNPIVRMDQIESQTRALREHGWVLQDRAADWAQAWMMAIENRRRDDR
jgi:hypothetical protein